ncbi:hypothetical protein ACOMHN_030364 [Nucella lapillus]
MSDTTQYSMDNESVSSPVPLQGLISSQTKHVIVDVISCGVQPIPLLLGIVGNLLSLVVLSYQGVKQTTNIILIGLALADLLYVGMCTMTMVECIFRRLHYARLAQTIQVLSVVHLEKLANVFSLVSRWYTCFVAVERFIAVLYPLRASSLMQKNRMLVASGLLWVFAFLSRVYHFLLFEAKEKYDPEQNITEQVAGPTTFLVENLQELRIGGILTALLSRYIPVLIVFVCTCFILRSLRASLAQRREMTHAVSGSEAAQQLQITKVLVSICLVFLLTSLPQIAINIARLLFAEKGFLDVGRYRNSHAVVTSVVLFFNILNSSVNVVFYVFYNQQFRATCRRLFTPYWKRSDGFVTKSDLLNSISQ